MIERWTEISRLQNSLQALGSTQKQLQEAISDEAAPDPEFEQALRENSIVIASQEERIVMLRKALEVQGAAIADNPHYDIRQPPAQAPPVRATPASLSENPTNPPDAHDDDDSEGVYL
ncbi:hypothetical protein FS749_001901 [Ceratobasidium sp. UAMH 11750]|nr:hypothetical protein FS749_001901 [Ceratobasidium sp. UAMH 11750]